MTRAPRDLGPRVRAGIESGRLGVPWWRRPGGLLAGAASLATVAAAALLGVQTGEDEQPSRENRQGNLNTTANHGLHFRA